MSEDVQLTIEFVPINSVHPAEWNARTAHDVERIAESIKVNGLRSPIGVWRETGDIVKGTGCWHALKRLGYSQAPVVFHDFPDREAAQKYSIADNRVAELSQWDWGQLREQLGSFGDAAGTGFSFAVDAPVPATPVDLFGEPRLPVAEEPAPRAPVEPPQEFPTFDETIPTEHRCPRCGYEWSGGER